MKSARTKIKTKTTRTLRQSKPDNAALAALRSVLELRASMNPLFHDQVHRVHKRAGHDYWSVSPNVVFQAHDECAVYIAAALNFVRSHGAELEQLLSQIDKNLSLISEDSHDH